jgi:hypothetical protein
MAYGAAVTLANAHDSPDVDRGGLGVPRRLPAETGGVSVLRRTMLLCPVKGSGDIFGDLISGICREWFTGWGCWVADRTDIPGA